VPYGLRTAYQRVFYGDSRPGLKHESLEQACAAIDALVRAEGRADVRQISGGEPTTHPQLNKIVRYALDQPIDYIMINTNGIRLAKVYRSCRTYPRSLSDFSKMPCKNKSAASNSSELRSRHYLDAYNFDVRRVMKCCNHHILPSGHIIPFCAYNVLYRNGHVPLPELIHQSGQENP
jgi:uncharacterized radical SAM superfamily Fe-S cluster-containing enzyme